MNQHAHMKLQSGVCMARHTVFDGIDLLFLDVQRESIQFFAKSHTKTFAINHCEEGRIECKFASGEYLYICLLYTSPSPRDPKTSRMPSSA